MRHNYDKLMTNLKEVLNILSPLHIRIDQAPSVTKALEYIANTHNTLNALLAAEEKSHDVASEPNGFGGESLPS